MRPIELSKKDVFPADPSLVTDEQRLFAQSWYRSGVMKAVELLREHENYKIMAKLVRGGYRNMTYDSDYELLLKDLGI